MATSSCVTLGSVDVWLTLWRTPGTLAVPATWRWVPVFTIIHLYLNVKECSGRTKVGRVTKNRNVMMFNGIVGSYIYTATFLTVANIHNVHTHV